jgi:ABC-type antimicrobial peptide transport system permease subunit
MILHFTKSFQTIPSFILAVVLVTIFRPNIVLVVAAIAIVSWPRSRPIILNNNADGTMLASNGSTKSPDETP